MKKWNVFLISILLVFTLAACGNQGSRNQNSGNNNRTTEASGEITTSESVPETERQLSEETSENVSESSGTEQETGGGKTLVVYYSASGNTEAVAGYIAAATNADIFELVPAEPYSNADLNWTDSSSRVVYEHDNPDDRNVELVEATVSDWESYDTVFIGYPIWWGIAAWPVDGFIEANDFTGKTVIPFCTSSSSGLGESGKLLEEAAGTGNWLEGERFSSKPSEKTVQTWIESLGL